MGVVHRGLVFGRGDDDRDSMQLIAGVEALLDGSYLERLERVVQPVPAWAWTNLLAHGSEDALRRAMTRRRTLMEAGTWRRARAYLAGEVLAAAEHAGSLSSVQEAVLIPLELELLRSAPPRATRAGQWAAHVLAALEDHRRVARRTT